MSLYALNLGQKISTVLGKNYHDDQHGVSVPNAESGTKSLKITTPKYLCFCTSLTRQSNAY